MLIYILILLLIANATTMIQEKAILYSRAAILGLLSIAYISYTSLVFTTSFLNSGLSLYNGLFNVTTFTQSFNLFIIILASLIAVLTAIYPKDLNFSMLSSNPQIKSSSFIFTKDLLGKNKEQYTIIEYALILLFILCGAMFLMSTGDLISLFLSIELQSYGLYILATLYRDSESATSSGLTYFLLGGLSSCFILLGSAILYVNSGTSNLDNIYIINSIGSLDLNLSGSNEIKSLIPNNYEIFQANYINLSFTILIVGFLFKISAAPFHFWSPDVYDGIPTIVTTFVAIIAKISLFALLLELVSNTVINNSGYEIDLLSNTVYYSIPGSEWKNILILSSLMSLIIGSLLGLTQYRIKRLFAYSTISHVGFILLALSINKMESIQGYIFYILQYSLSNLNAFLLLVAIGYSLSRYIMKYDSSFNNTRFIDKTNSPIQLLNQLKGYFYINQFLAISLAITLFSFIGIPPLVGFFAKQMVLSAALDQGYVFMTLVGVITSVIGAVYYLNIIKLIFFSKSEIKHSVDSIYDNYFIKLNNYLSIIISLLTMVITLFIFVPGEWFRIVSILSLSIAIT